GIETRVFERDRGLRRYQLQHVDPVRGEDARRQVVFKVESTRDLRLVDQRQTKNRADPVVEDVGIDRKWVLSAGVIDNNVVSSTHRVSNHGLGQHGCVDRGISLVYGDLVSAEGSLCLNQELVASLKDQETPFSPSVLEGRAHETVDQFFQNHLARNGLRDFDHRGQVQELGRRQDGARWRRGQQFLFEMRV